MTDGCIKFGREQGNPRQLRLKDLTQGTRGRWNTGMPRAPSPICACGAYRHELYFCLILVCGHVLDWLGTGHACVCSPARSLEQQVWPAPGSPGFAPPPPPAASCCSRDSQPAAEQEGQGSVLTASPPTKELCQLLRKRGVCFGGAEAAASAAVHTWPRTSVVCEVQRSMCSHMGQSVSAMVPRACPRAGSHVLLPPALRRWRASLRLTSSCLCCN